MKPSPAVSVIVPCYNFGAYVEEAIDSVLAQTFQDFEIVVINDGSTDAHTNRLLAGLERPRTTIFTTGNRGVAAARNHGIAHSSGRYICALDADDKLHPQFLERTIGRLEADRSLAFVSTWLECFGIEQWTWRQARCDFPALLAECVVLTAAPVRREALEAVGGYDGERFRDGDEDWDLWISLVERGYRGAIIPEALFYYRQREQSRRRLCARGDVRRRLWANLIDKHRTAYERFVTPVLLHKEAECGRLLLTNWQQEHEIETRLKPLIEERAVIRQTPPTAPATDATVVALQRELERVRAEVAALRGSRSWAITAPFRRLCDGWLAIRRLAAPRLQPETDQRRKSSAVAVVITCYDLGRILEEAVDSVLAQTRPADEIVVVDDGSTDPGTLAVLERMRRRTRVVTLDHGGVARARNIGVAATSAPLIVLLDGDDVLCAQYLERLSAPLDADASLDFVSCAVQAFEGADYLWKPPSTTALRTLTHGSVHVSSMFRRSLWNAVGGFDPQLVAYEDLDFWLRAIRAGGRGQILDEPLLRYRVRANSRYRQGIESGTYGQTMQRILERNADLVREHGTAVLLEKESFLVDVLNHQDHLADRREELRAQLERSAAVILAYHRVGELSPDTHRLCIAPDQFREHMRYLRTNCSVMSVEALCEAAFAGRLPRRAVAVTFDDGYRDALTTAAPILRDEGIPATFFVNTADIDTPHEAWHDIVEHIFMGPHPLPAALELPTRDGMLHLATDTRSRRETAATAVHALLFSAAAMQRRLWLEQLRDWSGLSAPVRDDRRLLTAAEVRELAQFPGVTIGSHTTNHLRLPVHDHSTQRDEIDDARSALEALVGKPVAILAYPFGEHDSHTESMVRTAHRLGVTIEPAAVTAATDPMRIPRLEVDGRSVQTLAAALDRLFLAAGPLPATGAALFAAVEKDAADRAWVDNDRLSRDEYHNGSTRLASRPQFLIVDPTSRCNARCVMCPVSFRARGDRGTDLPPALFDQVAPLFSTASQVNLFATGEPTIAPAISAMIDRTSDAVSRRTVVTLSTNGKHLPEPVLDRLAAPQTTLQFSVDGGTPEVFEAIRRGISFDELCRSLESAQRRRALNGRPSITFSTTVSKRNLHDLANVFDLAKRYGVDHVTFYEEDPEVAEEERFALDESDRPVFEAQRARIDASGIAYSDGLVFRGTAGLRAVEPEPPAVRPELRCLAPWKVFHLRADGSVRACCTLRRSMGDLHHQTVEQIWNGEEYVRLRRAFVEQSGIPGTCYRCTDPLRTWGLEA